jgi:hypothetical protein
MPPQEPIVVIAFEQAVALHMRPHACTCQHGGMGLNSEPVLHACLSAGFYHAHPLTCYCQGSFLCNSKRPKAR